MKKNMLCVLALALLAAVTTGLPPVRAEDPAPDAVQDPPELEAVRAEYLVRLQRAMQPVNGWFTGELGRLLQRFQRAGRLDAALHVQSALADQGRAEPPAGELEGEPPAELDNLRRDYDVRSTNAMRPVQSWHQYQLRSLVRRYTQRGELESARRTQEAYNALYAKDATQPAGVGTAAWRRPLGGRLRQEDGVVHLSGPGKGDLRCAVAVWEMDLPEAYTVSGEVRLGGTAGGFVIDYDRTDKQFACFHRGAGDWSLTSFFKENLRTASSREVAFELAPERMGSLHGQALGPRSGRRGGTREHRARRTSVPARRVVRTDDVP